MDGRENQEEGKRTPNKLALLAGAVYTALGRNPEQEINRINAVLEEIANILQGKLTNERDIYKP